AQLLHTPTETRERLAQHIFLHDGPNSRLGKQEPTLRNILAVEPLFYKVSRATGKKLPITQLDKEAQRRLDEGELSEQEA
ncbi:acyl-CoA dehydrogenase domain-containing protein, partial [Pseudoalteromonas ruthenica]|uniref:acyl-CoA dehydrogenase domain-containing protein n=1 Tax=Pseudoalteromonas ruthenica TaxID=151081 RepID=UPI00110B031A